MATRLRRSRRSIPPPAAFSKEEKFEKLMSYVTNNGNREALREFHIPTHILEGIINSPRSKTSVLEDLPLEVGMKIQDELTGNDLIMLALTSKTMASRVEACTTRKIANISYYSPHTRDASHKLKFGSTDDDWRLLGFLSRPKPRYGYLPPWDASGQQAADLRRRLQAHLGPKKYAFCFSCRKFRLKQKKFWNELIEHENPGITKAGANPKTKKQIAKILDEWSKTDETNTITSCPVHDLLREIRGKRYLKA